MKLPAISVRQPWATLLAHGLKHYETRSWRAQYEGPLAIHASATFHPQDRLWTLQTPEVCRLLAKCGYTNVLELPLGGVLAVGSLSGCYQTHLNAKVISHTERILGDWSPNRWAWRLDDVRLLQAPVWVRGHQGLWRCELPDDAIEVQP